MKKIGDDLTRDMPPIPEGQGIDAAAEAIARVIEVSGDRIDITDLAESLYETITSAVIRGVESHGEDVWGRVTGAADGAAKRAWDAATKGMDLDPDGKRRLESEIEGHWNKIKRGAKDLAGAAWGDVKQAVDVRSGELWDRIKNGDPRRRVFEQTVYDFEQRQLLPRNQFDKLKESAKKRAFTVAGLATEDMIATVHQELARQLKKARDGGGTDGSSLRDFRKFARDRLESSGWTPANKSHVETIYRTNVLSAHSSGRAAHMTSPEMLEARPFWEIRTVKDSRRRAAHAKLEGIVLPVDHPFWAGAGVPPWGYNCRCRVVSRSAKWAAQRGYPRDPAHYQMPTGVPDQGWGANSLGASRQGQAGQTGLLDGSDGRKFAKRDEAPDVERGDNSTLAMEVRRAIAERMALEDRLENLGRQLQSRGFDLDELRRKALEADEELQRAQKALDAAIKLEAEAEEALDQIEEETSTDPAVWAVHYETKYQPAAARAVSYGRAMREGGRELSVTQLGKSKVWATFGVDNSTTQIVKAYKAEMGAPPKTVREVVDWLHSSGQESDAIYASDLEAISAITAHAKRVKAKPLRILADIQQTHELSDPALLQQSEDYARAAEEFYSIMGSGSLTKDNVAEVTWNDTSRGSCKTINKIKAPPLPDDGRTESELNAELAAAVAERTQLVRQLNQLQAKLEKAAKTSAVFEKVAAASWEAQARYEAAQRANMEAKAEWESLERLPQATVQIRMTYKEKETTLSHELGHAIETASPRRLLAAKEFIESRTAGEEAVSLKTLFPKGKYRDDEFVKPDRFVSAYVGKDYGWSATEVTSVGTDNMRKDPAKFLRDDPEHFYFVLGQLAD